jgi:nonribosomal peptide synthetase DhbF
LNEPCYSPETIVELFAHQAVRAPGRTAVIDGGCRLTYEDIDRRSNRLARYLISRGVGPEDRVVLCLDRSAELVTVVLSVLKAGAAYVPLDRVAPVERVSRLIADCKPALVLTSIALRDRMPGTVNDRILCLDDSRLLAILNQIEATPIREDERCSPLCADHPAYLIYTSGSTGHPKAVMNTHRNVVRLFDANRAHFTFEADDTWTMFHSFTFDFSVWEIWGALLHGGRLVIVPKAVAQSPRQLQMLLRENSVTVLCQTPSAFARLVDETDGNGLAVRAVVLGGETCPVELAEAWGPQCQIYNGYGPTETAVFATMSLPLKLREIPSIGKPVARTRAFVLDAWMRPCPFGVIGELYIAGDGLARGYWNRPGLTAEKFVANPYASRPGERMYRTGDLASCDHKGEFHFHGRADQQLKIRGFRVEPGEIESALRQAPSIEQAVVIARDEGASALSGRRLVAYVVPARNGGGVTKDVNPAALREHLGQILPDYMIPSTFVTLDALPLTSNGKTDRMRLPAPERMGVSAAYAAPTTPEEKLLCQLVAALVEVPRAGLADHFFHLGGDSLTAMRLAAQIRTRLGRELAVQSIFEYPVLGDLAARIGLVTQNGGAFELLIPIRGTGSQPPLFCLHSGTGLCWSYTNLLAVTDSQQPIYGIQARGFSGNREIARSLEEIVADSIAAMRFARPHGPYRLLGWSFGGVVAHMVATQLQENGECVERLILLDSYPPPPGYPPANRNGHVPDRIWRDIARGTDLVVPTDAPPELDAPAVLALAQGQAHILGAFPLHLLEQLGAVMSNNSRLFGTARLSVFEGDIDLFYATQRTAGIEAIVTSPQAWAPFCTGTIRSVPVDAEHHRMLSNAALRQIGWLPLSEPNPDRDQLSEPIQAE